ncbi:hypothetical protein [Xylanimonas ulmi]|uniref:Uncharacterized protein n=1 Tax=Xylanimonas ulmi TaxID=228973 RepID=A0A4Q7LYS9_9MICO|nr:hypothetical protein [Xylanibacterium ulmi]RZS60455.1 hypothetical protein EV386_0713 [Xylanibacterium ulmi]
MPEPMKVLGQLLAASAEDRTLTYRLLPFGQPGRTNRGTITASAGAVTIPAVEELRAVNDAHDRERPLAKFTSVVEGPEGIEATVRVLATTAGDDFLVEASEGAKTGISVEIDAPVIRDGALLAGALSGAGFTTTPAFPGAQLVAADAGELPEDATDEVRDALEEALEVIEDNTEGDEPDNKEEAAVPEESQTVTASVPAGSLAARKTKRVSAFDLIASRVAGGDLNQLQAALDEANQADLLPSGQPSWLGEVWKARTFASKFARFFTDAPLNALNGVGWKFEVDEDGVTSTPTVDAYAGYPAQPHSSEVKTKAVSWTADRVAGANEFDLAFTHFQFPEFWQAFFREVADDTERKLDAKRLVHLTTTGNYVPVTSAVPAATDHKTLPGLVVEGVLAIQERTELIGAIVGADIYRAWMMTEDSEKLAYLGAAIGVDPATGSLANQFAIVPTSATALAGKALVVGRGAHTFYGPKLASASAPEIAKGGQVEALFAYYKTFANDSFSSVLVSKAAA